MVVDRNPILLPETKSRKPACPKCASETFTGKKIHGMMNFKCPKCGNEWQGGLPREPEDPLRPMLPNTSPPPIEQSVLKDKSGNIVGYEELRRPVSTVQSFRKGAPIPEDGEL